MNHLTISRTMQTAPAKPAMLVVGTALPVRLNGEIDTKTAKAGDTFQGRFLQTSSQTNVALATSTSVTGRVGEAKAVSRLSGAAELSLELVSVLLNGQPVAITIRDHARPRA